MTLATSLALATSRPLTDIRILRVARSQSKITVHSYKYAGDTVNQPLPVSRSYTAEGRLTLDLSSHGTCVTIYIVYSEIKAIFIPCITLGLLGV